MFATLSRSWEYAKMSYGLLWRNKRLLVFPILSTAAALVVTASFLLPLWMSGTIGSWTEAARSEDGTGIMPWVTLFLFYFCNYFVIVFFNVGLIGCVMRILEGRPAGITHGLAMAGKRLPQILGWALVSAVVGVVLRAIENAHEKAGQVVTAILGMAWTALTYFVVPIIVVEGADPVTAVKRSVSTLRSTWGEALVGNFSLGLLGFLIALPALLIAGLIIYAGASAGSTALLVLGVAVGVVLIAVVAAASAAADVIFKGLLYSYATGRTLPAETNPAGFSDAFRSRR